MNKIKKILFVTLLVFSFTSLTGCGKKIVTGGQKNVADTLVSSFKEIVKNETNVEKIADKISKDDAFEIMVGTSKVETEGYLDGFDSEIKGFNKAYTIKPMIGTIPFVAYVFETDDTVSLENTLREHADKRWNICTEADDLEISVVDNFVFVVMSPSSFE